MNQGQVLEEKEIKKGSIKNIFYAASGTALEWYNFSIYGYIAATISVLFFPHGDKMVALISSFGVFAASFLIRPLGGAFFGNLGDKIGRKKTLIVSLIVMGIATLMIGVLPTYDKVGYLAPLLLTIGMLLEGFSMGGQFSGVQVMLVEHAGVKSRGFVAAFGTLVSGCGVLISTLVITIITETLSKNQLLAWGWRIPFFIGVVMTVVIIFFQLKMEESPEFEKAKINNTLSKTPVGDLLKYSKLKVFRGMCIVGYSSLAYYMMAVFLPTFLTTFMGFPKSQVMMYTTIAVAIYAFTAPIWGYLSDSIGRKKVALTAVVIEAIIIYPMFYLFTHVHSISVAAAMFVIMIPVSAYAAIACSIVNEQFTTKERYSGAAIGINVGVAIGGLTPLISTELINATGNKMVPGLMLLVGAILLIIVISFMKETAGTELKEG